jgi:methyl-accepting chemotaxis protein
VYIEKSLFQFVFVAPLTIGIVMVLFGGSQSTLFAIGLIHMAILVLLALKVEKAFLGGSGIYVQYAGYIWTLIGVGSILMSFSNREPDITMLRGFLYGAGLAVSTSIIGWTFGRLLEDRAQVQLMESAAAAADDLARTLLSIKDKLERAGGSLSDAMSKTEENIGKMSTNVTVATKTLEDLSQHLKKSGSSLVETLNLAKSEFGKLVPQIEDFEKSMTIGLTKIKNGVNELAGLADHTKDVVSKLDTLATNVEKAANTTQKVVDQSVNVIEHTGRFIDKVFKKNSTDSGTIT